MKTAIRSLQQFSSYPLQVSTSPQQIKKGTSPLIVKKEKVQLKNSISANDPSNWDDTWFSNYE